MGTHDSYPKHENWPCGSHIDCSGGGPLRTTSVESFACQMDFPPLRVPCTAERLGMGFIAEVVNELDLDRPLDHPLRQPVQQLALAGDLLSTFGACHHLIHELGRRQFLDPISERVGVRSVMKVPGGRFPAWA